MLAVEPRVDVPLTESPLAPHSDRRDLVRLDKAIDRPKVDLQVFEYFFRGQEDFIAGKMEWQAAEDSSLTA